MEALLGVAALVAAAIMQRFNSFKGNNTVALKLGLVVVGLVFYALGAGLPSAPWGPPLLLWLEKAWPWALAVPGAASLIALHPEFATNSK